MTAAEIFAAVKSPEAVRSIIHEAICAPTEYPAGTSRPGSNSRRCAPAGKLPSAIAEKRACRYGRSVPPVQSWSVSQSQLSSMRGLRSRTATPFAIRYCLMRCTHISPACGKSASADSLDAT
jgi:hypothetical protein